MLGNDVVDLGDPETRAEARHPGFDRRVFGEAERRALARGPECLRWALWAAKEAAYKAARQGDPRALFSPQRFQVELDGGFRGRVRHPGGTLPVRVTRRGDCLHALAGGSGRSRWRVAERSGGDASAEVRALARRQLARALGCPAGELEIARQGRIPRVRRDTLPLALDLSLSHHGRYLALAWELWGTGGGASR